MATQGDPQGEMADIIASQVPWRWQGGPRKGSIPRVYHGVSRGYILSQILMRCDPEGRTIGQWRLGAARCLQLPLRIVCGCAEQG